VNRLCSCYQGWRALQQNLRSNDAEYSVVNSYQSKTFTALELIEKLTLVFFAVRENICSDMELENLLNSTVWAFQTSGLYYSHAARQRFMRDADRILRRMRTKRVRDRYRLMRREYLHRACCDVAELLKEIGTRWLQVMAALALRC
jgi:hypothetical protein